MSNKKEFFVISSVHRDDLADVIGEENANKFTDSDMERLASKMSDDYCTQLYWESMKILAEYLLVDIEGE